MYKVGINQAQEGMKLAADVVSDYGVILIPEGAVLTERTIRCLRNWDVNMVYIAEEQENVVRDRRKWHEQVKKHYRQTTERVMDLMEGLKGAQFLEVEEVREVAEELVKYANDVYSVKLLTEVKDKDYYTYQHSINVGIYTSLLGRWLGYEKSNMENLSLAGLLHDIGKTQIPEAILNKPGPLSRKEFAVMKRHPLYSYELLKHQQEIPQEVKLAVLQHHERINGNGYPFGLKGNKIQRLSQVVSVVDIFDAITSTRVYKERECPFAAVEELRRKCFEDLDPEIAYTFFERITEFFVGSTVIFDDGTQGEIIFLNRHDPTRPLVKVEDRFLDLAQNPDKEIVDVLVF